MPTYQYRCTECGHDLEAVQKFTDSALTECPNCSGQLRKVFNAVGVVFKGSGFYRTDSRSAEKTRDGDGGSGDKGSGDKGSGDKKSDGKESSAPAKEKAGSSSSGGSAGNGAAKPAGSGSGSGSSSGSGSGSSTPAKAASS